MSGIEQWVTIRGQDRGNPVLLFLHGGPGDVTSCSAFALFAPWEEHFTVVQWDQRGAGRTLRKSGPAIAPTLTVDRMAQDGIELAEYLRKHLGKEKIILVAHSFGSLVGLQMVRTRPDLFYVYVGTGQVADETKNYAAAYDALLRNAQAVGNQRAVDELTKVGPPPYSSGEGYGVQRKWSNAFEGADPVLGNSPWPLRDPCPNWGGRHGSCDQFGLLCMSMGKNLYCLLVSPKFTEFGRFIGRCALLPSWAGSTIRGKKTGGVGN